MSAKPLPAVEPPQPTDALAGFLSYLVPGLGQMTQGRFSKGLLFMVCLLGLFHVGQAMGNWQNVYMPKFEDPAAQMKELSPLGSLYHRWHFAGQFWIGISAWPAIWQYGNMPVPAAEGQPFWHRYQKPPVEDELNVTLRNSDKTPDLGWIFTVIAGMLNILVIYDAFAGPAFITRPPEKDRKTKEATPSPAGQEAALP